MRRAKVGDCGGRATYSRYGHWTVTISQYRGWKENPGYHEWKPIPSESIFNVGTVNVQLQASRLPLRATMADGRLQLSPIVGRSDVKFEGIRLKRFLKKYYSIVGEQRRPVSWSIGFDLPD